jgi:hypothetical protein
VIRARYALVLACSLGAVAASCFPSTLPPCTQREQLEARYVGELVAGCADAGSLAACPDFEAIKARHNARMKEASCRY